jgi:hypothetical protein
MSADFGMEKLKIVKGKGRNTVRKLPVNRYGRSIGRIMDDIESRCLSKHDAQCGDLGFENNDDGFDF